MEQKIPLFIMEEHNEAFFIWNYAIARAIIPASHNCLYHIDQHDDMSPERFNTSLHDLDGDLETVRNFTAREMRIANFLLPSAYMEIFDSIYWIKMKQVHRTEAPEKRYVRSYNNDGLKIISGRAADLPEAIRAKETHRYFDYFTVEIDQIRDQPNIILDFDLDYFSSIDSPVESETFSISITEAEYYRFISHPYHQLHYLGPKVEAKKDGNEYFYLVNKYNELYPSRTKVDYPEIDRRIEILIRKLAETGIKPLMIDICRSRYSGYTPSDQWKYIENKLLDGLKSIYPRLTEVGEIKLDQSNFISHQ